MQGKLSNTTPTCSSRCSAGSSALTGKRYGAAQTDAPFRVIADHIAWFQLLSPTAHCPPTWARLRDPPRAPACVALRRQRLGMSQPFIFDVAPTVAESWGPRSPSCARARHIQLLVRSRKNRSA
jgi:hypothetical protein